MGKQWKQEDTLFLGGSKISADGDYSHEIKRHLLLGRKAMTNLDSIFKSKDIRLPTKVHLVKVMIFPVVTYGYESWTMQKAEHQRIDAFELWCWGRLLSPLVYFCFCAHYSMRWVIEDLTLIYVIECEPVL